MPNAKFLDGAGDGASEQGVNSLHAGLSREMDEPEDGFEPVPSGWIMLALALAMTCGWYLARFSGDFDVGLIDGDRPAAVASTGLVPPPPVDPVVAGRRVFNNCAGCHQLDGGGVAGAIPPLEGSEWVTGDEQVLIRILLHGLNGPLTVAGSRYDGAMPAWGSLSDAQIAHVLTFIRSAWGNSAAPVEARAVAEQRGATAGRDEPWTAAALVGSAP